MKIRYTAAALLAGGTLVLTACGSDAGHGSGSVSSHGSSHAGTTSSPNAAAHNAADVEFATGMVPHHQQAVEMAEIALSRSRNAEVRALATAVKGAQAPEIALMTGWLAGWGEQVPSGMSMDGMEAHGDHSGDGMMSAAEMTQLENGPASAFDELWLTLMIKHHEGAVEMSQREQQLGNDPEARALAQRIVDAQQHEIATMKALLK